MNKAPRFRIELTRQEGWAILEYFQQMVEGKLGASKPNLSAIKVVCEKIRTRMGLNGEKYGER